MKSSTLDKFIHPASIAVIGASDNITSVGGKVFKNILSNGYKGKIFPINLKHKTVQGIKAFATLKEVQAKIDLVIMATPARTALEIVKACAELGIKNILILSAGFNEAGDEGKQLEKQVLAIAQQYNIRIIGPNCLGIILPFSKLNATFSNATAKPGEVGLISQSGAICASILDWAVDKEVGFSGIFSLGNAIDIDFADTLNYFALDTHTKSILLYIESIKNARKFMSALRAVAKIKPVVVIKAGTSKQGTKAAVSHTGAIVGQDDVFDAAFKRAGVVRVRTLEQLFAAAQIPAHYYTKIQGTHLAVITNGGGAGVMAADQVTHTNITLPELNPEFLSRLNEILPVNWSHQNPLDILGDASSERYQKTVALCLKEPSIDGLLLLLTPVATSEPLEVAKKVSAICQQNGKPLLTCWLGEHQVNAARNYFLKNHIPTYDSPELAVEAFSYLSHFYQNQQLLQQVPSPSSHHYQADVASAKKVIELALKENRKILTTIESKAILAAFGIPVTQTITAKTSEEALSAAKNLGYPLVMKILSPDITHKQDVEGVQVNIMNAQSVSDTFNSMITQAKAKMPKASIVGVTLEKMRKEPHDRELMIGMFHDVIFGPVISFGGGGTIVEVIKDRAVALPPLNHYIAQSIINQTKISKLLGEFRHMPKVKIDELIEILLKVSHLICEIPELREMDINPLIINENSAIAVDARMVIDKQLPAEIPYSHMAIHPYPSYLISQWQFEDKTPLTIRPVRPDDAGMIQEFIKNLSTQTKYYRYRTAIHELSPFSLVKLTQIDFDREIALVGIIHEGERQICIADVRYVINPDEVSAEFGIVIADNFQLKGLGKHLMTLIIQIAKSRGISLLQGEVMANNAPMLQLMKDLGFTMTQCDDPSILNVKKIFNHKQPE